jgi:methylenetetrahydrofolate reductase (NADPH)
MTMQKITDIFAAKPRTFSFEIFPPKTEKGLAALYKHVEELAQHQPDYISVTYGAGGSTSKSTREIINTLHQTHGLTCMHHLTLVGQTREVLGETIQQLKDDGIRNILALRGDPTPEMGEKFQKVKGGLEYCYELVELIREIGGDFFSIGVAGFPEVHPDCPTKELDTDYLKLKLDHGADFVVTQYFFDNAVYSDYLDRTARAGITARIIPGLLPITDYDKLLTFSARCGAYICKEIHDTFAPFRTDPEMILRQGTDYALRQTQDLLRRGAAGIHFYCLNQVEPVRTLWERLQNY